MEACRPLLGTYVSIRVDTPFPDRGTAALAAAFAAIEQVQYLMSFFRPDSDVDRINSLRPGEQLEVHPWTREILGLAQDLHASSEGLFDCAIAPQLAAWGLLPDDGANTGENMCSSLSNLCVDENGQVRCSAPLRIDLGGIAKGFAVDKAAEALLANGINEAIINAGGDLRVLGKREEAIHVRDPANPEILHFVGQLSDGACATSATYFSRRNSDEGEVSALVHPRSRQALRSRKSYTVIAPQCVLADALTKVLALSDNPHHPCFARYGAHPLIVSPS